MKIKFGLLETIFTSENPEDCADEHCLRLVNEDDVCFIDTQTNDIFCKSCGQCERYHRKKEEERNVLS